jgi:hypothetical protein
MLLQYLGSNKKPPNTSKVLKSAQNRCHLDLVHDETTNKGRLGSRARLIGPSPSVIWTFLYVIQYKVYHMV